MTEAEMKTKVCMQTLVSPANEVNCLGSACAAFKFHVVASAPDTPGARPGADWNIPASECDPAAVYLEPQGDCRLLRE